MSIFWNKNGEKTYGIYDCKTSCNKVGLSERRLQTIYKEGMFPKGIKFGRSWAIPVDAQKPVDKRIKSGKYCLAQKN